MLKKLFSLTTIATLLPFFAMFTQPVQAAEDFDLSLETVYQVQPTGITTVNHNFTVTNTTPERYLTKYGTKLISSNIDNIVVTDQGNVVQPTIVTTDNQTSIGIEFDSPVVGKDKQRKFTISYQTSDVAFVNGKALEVYVPRLADNDSYDSYRVELRTPILFGAPTKVTPSYSNWYPDGNIITIFEDVGETGVSALFGTEQIFEIELDYNLLNPSGNTGITEIALPPDTSFQEVAYQELTPQPKSQRVDQDGNWIATYELEASKELTVSAKLLVKTTFEPNPNFIPSQPVAAHLNTNGFWATNTELKSLAAAHQTPRDIYEIAVETLSYNHDKVGPANVRLGATGAIADPNNAVCQEYTDLFISLARENNIPARRLTGYAHSENELIRPLNLIEDALHAWPEFYDSEKGYWVPVDPTWADTTGQLNYFDQLDLNHVVFAINGVDTELPYPAGLYKLANTNSDDIRVSFATDFPQKDRTAITATLEPRTILGWPLLGVYNLVVSNSSGHAFYQLPITTSTASNISPQHPTQIEVLLPFETRIIPVSYRTNSWLQIDQVDIQLQVADVITNQTITTSNNLTQLLSRPKTILAVGLGLVITTLGTGSILVFRRKKRRFVRR